MKIPILKEIKITNYSVPELVESLKRQEAGHFPTYIVLDTTSLEETREVLTNIAAAFVQLNINPKFPYPFYAVTEKVQNHPSIPIYSTIHQLPRHFHRSPKRLRRQELLLLNKINLLKDKVVNLPFFERLSKIKKSVKGQRGLYRVTKQLHFLETMLEELHKRNDNE